MTKREDGAPAGVLEGPCATAAESSESHGPRGLVDRELSWLDFNARVLQEAADPDVPLFERLRFMGIFASNLDEFFRVRVASLRSLLRLKKKKVRRLSLDPDELLTAIHDVVTVHQEWFGRLLRDELVPALAERGILLTDERDGDEGLRRQMRDYFEERVRPLLRPLPLRRGEAPPLLHNGSVYLAVELLPRTPIMLSREAPDVVMVRVPPSLDRFVRFPGGDGRTRVMFLDDVIRAHLPSIFPRRRVVGAWAVAVSRDAELYLEREFAGDVVEAIKKSLRKRKTAELTRFLFDPDTPMGVMNRMKRVLALEPEDLIEGGRYPNLDDLMEFPTCGVEGETYPEWPPAPHPELSGGGPIREVVEERDQLLHFPYQHYDHVVRFLTEAAEDPEVESIRLTIYRVSTESRVLRALLEAAERGKDVRVFVEAKARFDEESNLEWAERLERAGVVAYYSFEELKVHAKIALVVRRTEEGRRLQAYLGTGNFNEETALYYTDFALLTADPELTEEVERVFHFLEGREDEPRFRHLLVAPFNLRERISALVRAEIERAERGEDASITFKVNGLEDEDVIGLLCEAARAGVEVRGIVRGICRLLPDEGVWGETLQLRSIVDRYLEHGRVYVFGNGGRPLIYAGSADWMYRNLNRRVEVAFPVHDPSCRAQLQRVLDIQLADNRKARVLAAEAHNRYARSDGPEVRAQEAIHRWLSGQSEGGSPSS